VLGALRSSDVDGILTLGPGGAAPTLAALRDAGRLGSVHYGTFDLSTDVLEAVQAGDMVFAIDQQPYLQGYLGVVSLVKYLETGVMAGGGQLIRTGPAFVTRENAGAVIELAERGIR
jgi:simple sugar transport system substrate-binding protein